MLQALRILKQEDVCEAESSLGCRVRGSLRAFRYSNSNVSQGGGSVPMHRERGSPITQCGPELFSSPD